MARICSYCGEELGEVSDEQRLEYQRRRLRDRIYHLKMASYTCIAVLVLAAGWYWWESSDFSRLPSTVPVVLVSLGTVGYLVVRVMLFNAKRRMRKLREAANAA
jgi:hypothetical protein